MTSTVSLGPHSDHMKGGRLRIKSVPHHKISEYKPYKTKLESVKQTHIPMAFIDTSLQKGANDGRKKSVSTPHEFNQNGIIAKRDQLLQKNECINPSCI